MSSVADETVGWEIILRWRKGECAFLPFSSPLANRILASDVHLVEHEAKARLLSGAVPFLEEYNATAKQILGYVQGLSEGALKDVFTLKSDDISHIPSRMLNPSPKDEGPGVDQYYRANASPKLKCQSDRVEKITLADGSRSSEAEESYLTASCCWLKPAETDDVNTASTETQL